MLIVCLAEQWGQVKSSCYHFASTSSSNKMTRKSKCLKSRLHFQLNVVFGVVYYVYILYVSMCVDGTFRPALICKVSKHFTWYDISQINLNKWNNFCSFIMLICVIDKTCKKFENAQWCHTPHKLRSSLTIILSMFTSNLSCSTVLRASAILAMLLDIPLVDDFLPMRHQNKTVVCVTEVRGGGGNMVARLSTSRRVYQGRIYARWSLFQFAH